MVEDDAICIVKLVTGYVKDTEFAASWEVVAKRIEAGAERIKACRRNAETDDEEIS